MFHDELMHSEAAEHKEGPLAPEIDENIYRGSGFAVVQSPRVSEPVAYGEPYEYPDEENISPMMLIIVGLMRASLSRYRIMSMRELGSGMLVLGFGLSLAITAQRISGYLSNYSRPMLRANFFKRDEKVNDNVFQTLGDRISSNYQLLCKIYGETEVDQLIANKDMLCPIYRGIITHPVLTSTNRWYDQRAIEDWFARGRLIDPLSREPIFTIVKSTNKQREILSALEEVDKVLSAKGKSVLSPCPHQGVHGAGKR